MALSPQVIFGFLVACLVVFLSLMLCAMRGGVRAQATARLETRAEARAKMFAQMPKPIIWDAWVAEGREIWSDMKPLAATLLQRNAHTDALEETSNSPEAPSPSVPDQSPAERLDNQPPPLRTRAQRARARLSLTTVPLLSSFRSTRPSVDEEHTDIPERAPAYIPRPQTLQVAVLISMPSQDTRSLPLTKEEEATGGSGEYDTSFLGPYVLGVSQVPWHAASSEALTA